jgi:hypothetical protein
MTSTNTDSWAFRPGLVDWEVLAELAWEPEPEGDSEEGSTGALTTDED